MKNYTICVDYCPAAGNNVRIYGKTITIGGAKPLGEWLAKNFPLYDWVIDCGQDRENTDYCRYIAKPEMDEYMFASLQIEE